MRNSGQLKFKMKTGSAAARLVVEAAAIICRSAVGGDNAPSDRVTPRNFRKTRKPNGAAEDAATCETISGERFMERYAPKLMELAPRDRSPGPSPWRSGPAGASRGGDYVHLDLTHLGKGRHRCQAARHHVSSSRVYQGVEPITQPVPTTPTAHYAMGGIPTNTESRVVIDEHGTGAAWPVRGGRMCLCQRPRRQPPGHQLAHRHPRLRSARGPVDGPRRGWDAAAGTRPGCRRAGTRGDRDAACPGSWREPGQLPGLRSRTR